MKSYITTLLFLITSVFAGASVKDIFPIKQDKDTTELVQKINYARQFYQTETPDYDSIIIYLNEALEFSLKQSLDLYTYEIYDEYTNVLIDTRNYSLATDYYFKMLHLLDMKNVGKEEPDADLLFQYSLLYRYIGACMSINETEKGYEYSMKSLDVLEELAALAPDYPEIDESRLFIYNNILAGFIDSNDFDRALIYAEKVLNYPTKIDLPLYYATLYNNLGIIYWELNKRDEAFDFYDKAFKIREELGDEWGIGILYFNIGKCYFLEDNYDEALKALILAKEISGKTSNLKIEMYATDYLARLYKRQKDYTQSIEMLEKSYVLKDSLNNSDKVNDLIQIEMKYLLEKQIWESELKQEILVGQKERNVMVVIFVSVLLFFLLLLVFLLYNNQRIKNKKNLLEQESLSLQNENLELKNQQLKQTLENKTKELNSHMKYLLKKNEFVTEIIENVSDIKETDNKNIDKAMEVIKGNLETSVWNEFNLIFQNLHQDFYQKLYEAHNNLTPNEKRLCAFIKLNLSTKEISSITFQSTKSIEIARSRLRKKLGLNRDESLSLYLSQF